MCFLGNLASTGVLGIPDLDQGVKYPCWSSSLVVWLPCKLAWWRLLTLSGSDACLVIKPSRAPGGRVGRKKYKTPNSPLALFLVSLHSLWWFWGCLVWHLWIGRARHPGPGSGLGVEVFNISGWLTNGDFALEAEVDFLAVVEHRLVPARARSECRRLRGQGISSVWSPASQDFSPVGNAGVALRGLRLLCPRLLLRCLRSSLVWVELFDVSFRWAWVGSCTLLFCTVIMVLTLMLNA